MGKDRVKNGKGKKNKDRKPGTAAPPAAAGTDSRDTGSLAPDTETRDTGKPADVFELGRFLESRGYTLPGGFYERYFRSVAALGMEDADVSQQAPIIKTILVKDQETEAKFDFDLDDYVQKRKERSSEDLYSRVKDEGRRQWHRSYAETESARLTGRIEKKKRRLENSRKRDPSQELLSAEDEASLTETWMRLSDSMEGLLAPLPAETRDVIRYLPTRDGIATVGRSEAHAAMRAMRDMMKKAVMCPDWTEVLPFLQKLSKLADTAASSDAEDKDRRQRKREYVIQALEVKRDRVQERLDRVMEGSYEGKYDDRLVLKMKSVIHRKEFLDIGRAVQVIAAPDAGPQAMDAELTALTDAEKEEIREYIRSNAGMFRTNLSRNIRTSMKRTIDIAETCKKACSTNGIPMALKYKRALPQKAKLILLLDISGSCRQASEIMLYLMCCMKDVFKGGCRMYAFVDSLYDISGLCDLSDPGKAIRDVLNAVPTRGAYSDYGTLLQEFYNAHMGEVTKDTVMFFIGDARNNKNASGAGYLGEISGKCREAYWLNTERRAKWDTGDSIIREYAPFMDGVYEAVNARSLLAALERIR